MALVKGVQAIRMLMKRRLSRSMAHATIVMIMNILTKKVKNAFLIIALHRKSFMLMVPVRSATTTLKLMRKEGLVLLKAAQMIYFF